MARETVRVENYRAFVKSLRELDKDVAKGLRAELRSIGQLVQRDAAALLAPVDDRSAQAFKVRVRQSGVAVEQSLRRTTGDHPEFGALQMREALLPALRKHEDEVTHQINALLDREASRNGF